MILETTATPPTPTSAASLPPSDAQSSPSTVIIIAVSAVVGSVVLLVLTVLLVVVLWVACASKERPGSNQVFTDNTTMNYNISYGDMHARGNSDGPDSDCYYSVIV